MITGISGLRAATAILLALFVSASHAAMAEGLTIRPIRVDLNDDQRSDAVMVTNGEATAQLLRVDAVSWDQSTGDDVYTPNGDADLFVVPSVLNAQAGESRAIRLGLRHPVAGTRERAYRIFITEVPSMLETTNAVTFTFRVGIPVFVTAGKPVQGAPTWKAQLTGPAQIRLTASNPSDTHLRIDMVRAFADASKTRVLGHGDMREYILGHATRSFDFDFPEALVLPTLVVDGMDADDVPFSVVVPVLRSSSAAPAVSSALTVPIVAGAPEAPIPQQEDPEQAPPVPAASGSAQR